MNGSLRWTARSLTLDRNPLRRGVDRAEAIVLAVLAVTLVAGAPLVASLAGHAADVAAVRAQHAERGSYQVSARLLEGARQAVIPPGGMAIVWVRASWSTRDGEHRTGPVAAGLDARAGQRVRIWVTAAGQQTSPRLGAAGLRERVLGAMGLAVTGWLAVLALGGVCVHVLANRRRLAGWQHEWDTAGPGWSRQG